tara:strand:+ start:3381 stop:4949 length:1569 start_codon:yes stop_codon:yes gene_type:complete
MNNYWTTTDWPTLEITTSIPKQGCVVDCVFCPQRVLQKIWNEKHFTTEEARTMKLEDFKMVIDKLPKQIRITFSGFTEPWLNRNTSAMLLYAHQEGHPVSVFTTAVGMKLKDVELIKNIPYCGGPNGGFTLHLPDRERLAKHPITKTYIKVCQALKDANIKNFTTMSMGEVHEEVEHIYPDKIVNKYEMWHRAGNLLGEAQLKPEVKEVFDRFKSVMHNTEKTCGCIEGLYHNILLPNGEVSLCCMDYNLDEILGNLYTQEYDDILPAPNTTYDMCMMCENGVDPVKSKTSIIKTMGEAETVDSKYFFAPDEMVQYLGFDINPEKRVPEADLIQSMRQYIFPNKTFVDVGAHIGTYTWILGPYAQKVYAFEPTQRIYNHLCANIMIKGLSDKVDTYNCGLSSQNGKLPFYERQPDGGTNGFTPIGWKDENTYELPVMKLDEFEIKDISLIKIDVEGHELEVIKGAYETLIDNEYPPILFESWEPEGSQLKGDLRTELFNYLYELGYAIEHTAYPDIFLATRN